MDYIPLNKEELGYLKSLFTKNSVEKIEFEAELYSQQMQKIITKRQADNKLKDYNTNYYVNIFSAFRDKYHKWPLSIPSWMEKISF